MATFQSGAFQSGTFQTGTAPPVTPTVTGGHYWPKRNGRDIEPEDWRRKSREERRAALQALIAGVNEAPVEVVEAAKAAVSEYEAPKAPDARLVVRKAALDRLAADIQAVERLARVLEEYEAAADDEAMVLLLSG